MQREGKLAAVAVLWYQLLPSNLTAWVQIPLMLIVFTIVIIVQNPYSHPSKVTNGHGPSR